MVSALAVRAMGFCPKEAGIRGLDVGHAAPGALLILRAETAVVWKRRRLLFKGSGSYVESYRSSRTIYAHVILGMMVITYFKRSPDCEKVDIPKTWEPRMAGNEAAVALSVSC